MIKQKLASKWPYVWLAVLILIFTAARVEIAAEDLIINGTTLMLHGKVEYNRVIIINGGVLYVTPFDGFGGTGMLTIKAGSIVVDATSAINADGAGYRGLENRNGEGPGGGKGGTAAVDGGGGGAYGGQGGSGAYDYWIGGLDGAGGVPYGNAKTMNINMGSAGGAAGTLDYDYGGYGGYGGGAISLQADTIDIFGTISANGQDGLIYLNDSSGGGAGGGIFLKAKTITIDDGYISANGGNGGSACGMEPCLLDDGGGGGSGGRIKIFYTASLFVTANAISVKGGKGAFYGQDGQKGTYFKAKIPVTAEIDIKPDTLNLKSKGKFITAYIELPKEYDPADIVISSIKLNNMVPVELHPIDIGDKDNDGIPDLMVKFSRAAMEDMQSFLRLGKTIAITIKGKLTDGTKFTGSDTIRVIGR